MKRRQQQSNQCTERGGRSVLRAVALHGVCRSRRNRRGGSVTLEFILAFPILFIATLAIFEFGILMLVEQAVVVLADRCKVRFDPLLCVAAKQFGQLLGRLVVGVLGHFHFSERERRCHGEEVDADVDEIGEYHLLEFEFFLVLGHCVEQFAREFA